MSFFRRLVYYGHSVFRILFNFKPFPLTFLSLLRKDQSVKQSIFLRHPPLQFVTRGGMDLWSIKETFLDAFYTRYGVPIRDGWKIIDVGAGIGDFSIYAVYANPNAVVYAYEPFPESYQLLVRNINVNGFENILPVNSAVWRHDGILQLDTKSGEPLQVMSKSTDASNEGQSAGEISVQAISLGKVFDDHEIDKLDLLKLDCEGAEYEILMGGSPEVLQKVDRIIMEYHDIDHNHHHKALASFLEDMGYTVTCYDNFVHEDIGYLFAIRE